MGAMRRIGVLAAALAAVLAGAAVSGPAAAATPAPTPTGIAPVGTALTAMPLEDPVLTLPAGDGLRDELDLRIRSGAAGQVDVLAERGKRTVPVAAAVRLRRVGTAWQRTVEVPVDGLTRGAWRLLVRRTAAHGIRTTSRIVVGSGEPTTVSLVPVARTVQPYPDGVLDAVDATVTAADETGEPLPVSGTLRVDAGKRHRVRTLRAGSAAVPVIGLPLGPGRLTADVRVLGTRVQRTTSIVLAPTAVGPLRLARSSDTVQPVVDGLLDSVTLTASGGASRGSPAPVAGTLTIAAPTGAIVQSWPVTSGAPTTFRWDGRVGGAIVPGTYLAVLMLHGPEGVARSTVRTITVSSDHLPWRVRDLFTVADGNQQGLAVHDGIFYVGYDDGDGTARIERYDSSGAHLPLTLAPLAIGHAAELAYSTTTGLLYAANGGATTPTTVWAIDPEASDGASAVRATYDLSRLGNCGMVAVDDAHARLLVFAGAPGSYTVTPVSLVDATTTAADGTTTTVPAGTLGTSLPIAVTGTPQGLEAVGDRLWVYSSLRNRNHVAQYDLATAAMAAGTDADLMTAGEGEGLAADVAADGTTWLYVGAHSVDRIGVLEPVPDV